MKKIIFKAIVFILLFFILDSIFCGLFSILHKRTDFFYNKLLVKKPDIIFFGNSKTRHDIIPKIIEQKTGMSAYNIARYGSGVLFSYGAEAIILPHYRPKLFVIQAMSLTKEREALDSLAPYFDNRNVKRLLSYYPYDIKIKYNFFKTARYNSILLTIIYRLFTDYDPYDGYVPLYGISNINRAVRLQNRGSGRLFSFISGKNLLVKFIEEARREMVDVIIVEMPTLHNQRSDSYNACMDISRRYNVTLLDFSRKEKDFKLSSDYFRDASHLNDEGAKVFSSVLGEEIARLMKR